MSDGQLVEIRAEKFDDAGCEPMLLFWYVEAGDRVAEGQELCEVETAKAVFVLTAPAAGILREVCVTEGGAVESEQVLGRIETEQ